VATPIDPRHRLVTTKYNPARTWTPPNVVGIGGAYMCIYGMEGPGGYQLFGRTIQVWNTYRQTEDFVDGKPWLLRFFDQVKFFPVSAGELVEWRREFPAGRRKLKIEQTTFSLKDYRAFLSANADGIASFQAQREAAFAAERERWRASGEFERVEALTQEDDSGASAEAELPPGCEMIEAPLGGSVWKLEAKIGDRVAADGVVAIVEAMKTECAVHAPVGGIIRAVYVKEKQMVAPGAALFAIEPS
jgi:urea carboxylase